MKKFTLILLISITLTSCTSNTNEENLNSVTVDTSINELDEVSKHATKDDCWTIIDGTTYDLSNYYGKHPGGAESIIEICGTDGTDAFNKAHTNDEKAKMELESLPTPTKIL